MGVGAENAVCFENMGFGNNQYASMIYGSSQDCFLGSFTGIEDDNLLWKNHEIEVLDQLNSTTTNNTLHQLQYPQGVDSCGNIAASSTATTSESCSGSLPAVEIMQCLNSELERQRLEMDFFLQLENKRLRRLILEEHARQQQALLMHKLHSRINLLMHQRDQEIAVARNKGLELQHLLKSQEMESLMWQKRSSESEAIIADLNNRIKQLEVDHHNSSNSAKELHGGDAVSFCESSSSSTSEEEEEDRLKKETLTCKLCKARRSCVVLFPCRDLCCCKNCEPLLGQCPVCGTVKESALEVFFA